MSKRSDSVDLLRGLVMALMALDHTRDYFSNSGFNPTDLTQVGAPIFLTRWVTHLCAPVFVFLAGLATSFSMGKGKAPSAQAAFLVKRGLWLIFLELTVVRVAWYFNLNLFTTELQVLWAIGVAMLALAGLVFFPPFVAGLVGLVIVAGHNAFDQVHAADLPAGAAAAWRVLHEPGVLWAWDGGRIEVLYPVLPWVGVMALGYGFGALWKASEHRARLCATLGSASLAVFVAVRSGNFYGDAAGWQHFETPLKTALSFVNVTKYPPSFQYVALTLGVACLLLAGFEFAGERLARALAPLTRIGRVPMFYYLIHIYLIHALALGFVWLRHGTDSSWDILTSPPAGWGFGLPVVYLVWISVLALAYPLCLAFAELKRRSRHPLLAYL